MIYIIILITIIIISLYLVTLQKEKITKSLNKMYNCFDIADYLLKKAKDEGQGIDPMKLLKLTYISHGYNLGFFDKPLFSNQVQAWKYGSVIPDLYQVIKRFGNGYVDKDTVDLYKEKNIEGDQKKLLDFVWEAYKPLSGLQLSELTHQKDTPWEKTYKSYNDTIPNEIIKEHYKTLISDKRGA